MNRAQPRRIKKKLESLRTVENSNLHFTFLLPLIFTKDFFPKLKPLHELHHSSVGKASHRYDRGHGFESHRRLNWFFRILIHTIVKLRNKLRRSSLLFKINLCTTFRPEWGGYTQGCIKLVHKGRDEMVGTSQPSRASRNKRTPQFHGYM